MPYATRQHVASSFPDLVRSFELRPIRSEERFDEAIAVMKSLLGLDLTTDQADYLVVLGLLIREYEAEHVAMPAVTPADILHALLEDRGTTQAELAAATGIAESNISAMLANRRGIGKKHRAAFAEYFGVAPTRFVVA